jgi:toxin ParE1/3/4
MTQYVLSPRAQADLEDIWAFTTNRWGLTQAEVYIRQIQSSIETVAAAPALGRACDEIRSGYRKYRTGSHVIFYRLTDGGIDVVRILHARMDFGRHL